MGTGAAENLRPCRPLAGRMAGRKVKAPDPAVLHCRVVRRERTQGNEGGPLSAEHAAQPWQNLRKRPVPVPAYQPLDLNARAALLAAAAMHFQAVVSPDGEPVVIGEFLYGHDVSCEGSPSS